MTEFLNTLQQRRSIRRFKAAPVSPELLEKVLQAAQCSPSWNNTQCWEFVIIDHPETRKKLQATVPPKNPAYRAIVESSTLICVCARTRLSGYFGTEPGSILGDWFMHDIGMATQNLCNQAHALGLGTVVVGWLDHIAAKNIIGIPDGYELVSLIPLGYPDQKAKPFNRKKLSEFTHKNQFGKRYFND
jgi:nitroreductase